MASDGSPVPLADLPQERPWLVGAVGTPPTTRHGVGAAGSDDMLPA
jgi:hypothetical protein